MARKPLTPLVPPEPSSALEDAKQRMLELQADQLELERQVAGLRQMVDDLARSQALCRGAIASMPGGFMAVFDSLLRIVTGGGDSALTGVPLAKRIGFGFEGVLAGRDLHRFNEAARRTLAGQAVNLDMRLRGAELELSFRPFPADESGKPRGLVVAHDVSDHVRAERRLTESREYLQDVVELTGDGAFELDMVTGRARVSRRWSEITGSSPDEHVIDALEFERHVHPDDVVATEAVRRAFREGTTGDAEVTCRIRWNGEHYRWIRMRLKTVAWDARGQPLRAIGTFAPIPPPTDPRA